MDKSNYNDYMSSYLLLREIPCKLPDQLPTEQIINKDY